MQANTNSSLDKETLERATRVRKETETSKRICIISDSERSFATEGPVLAATAQGKRVQQSQYHIFGMAPVDQLSGHTYSCY